MRPHLPGAFSASQNGSTMKLNIQIPCYNEEENVTDALANLPRYQGVPMAPPVLKHERTTVSTQTVEGEFNTLSSLM